ncbi:MAG: hypothetical protein OXH65_10870 [Paracoccaceae bacterium]|nr:hypothetical protein [Paracoccaceae bacterium]MYG09233.1 hypothetical protein [Paracoccaceae bacterium]MYJ86089.1 hypothetical protein [Paracoccaceae bacterium]
MSDNTSDRNEDGEEIAEIIAESPPEQPGKGKQSNNESRLNRWMDKIAGLIFRAIVFGLIAGGVGVALILLVPQQFLPSIPSEGNMEISSLMEESVSNIGEQVAELQTTVIPAIEERISGLEENISQLSGVLEEADSQNATLASELNTINEVMGNQMEQLTRFGTDLDTLTGKHDEIRSNLDTTLVGLQESLVALGADLEVIEADNMKLKEDFTALSWSMPMSSNSGSEEGGVTGSSEGNQAAGTNGQMILLEARIQRIGEKILEIDVLSRSLTSLGEEVTHLQMELSGLSTNQGLMNELVENIENVGTQLPGLEEELALLQEQNRMLANQIVEARDTTAVLESELVALSSQTVGENSLRNLTLVGIQAAVEAGIPYAAIIGESESNSLELPAIILELSEDGVATLLELQNEFEDLITEALKAVETGAERGSIQDMARSIVSSLVQVRSLTPREGDDAVAVLSRLEERLKKGDLGSVLELYAQLPQPVQVTLESWKHKVQNRLDLLIAVEESLSKPLTVTGQ